MSSPQILEDILGTVGADFVRGLTHSRYRAYRRSFHTPARARELALADGTAWISFILDTEATVEPMIERNKRAA